MTLPTFAPTIAPEARAVILAKLSGVAEDHNVRILFAIESGSRAWGFPSPDSDYDVRFVYAHSPDWYISLTPGRDVIELPLEGDWDINGWDIRKALGLLLRPNPVLLEWLSSPVRYLWDPEICDRLSAFAAKTTFGPACLHHYRNLAQRQWDRHVGESETVNLKKYFYILRPALAISWLRERSDTPPMNLQHLVAGQGVAAELVDQIAALLELKRQAKEIGQGARIPLVDGFIQDQLRWAATVSRPAVRPDLRAEGDRLFREIVKGGGDG